jgi:hypothetical protein
MIIMMINKSDLIIWSITLELSITLLEETFMMFIVQTLIIIITYN